MLIPVKKKGKNNYKKNLPLRCELNTEEWTLMTIEPLIGNILFIKVFHPYGHFD